MFAKDLLKDRVILITGGGSGLGYSMAEGLGAVSAQLIITGRNADRLGAATIAAERGDWPTVIGLVAPIAISPTAEQAIASGFKNVILMGDHGGGQPTVYADVATLIADQVKLMNEGRFDYVEGLGLPQPDDSYVLLLEAVKYFSADAPPDDAAMLAGLAFIPGTSAADTQTLYDFYNRLAPIVDFTKFTGDWFLPHPLTDFFLPRSKAAAFIEETLANTPVADIGFGPVLIYPFPRSKVTAPFVALPNEPICVLMLTSRGASPRRRSSRNACPTRIGATALTCSDSSISAAV